MNRIYWSLLLCGMAGLAGCLGDELANGSERAALTSEENGLPPPLGPDPGTQLSGPIRGTPLPPPAPPNIWDILPNHGVRTGGEQVRITGLFEGLGIATVKLGNVPCAVTSALPMEIRCTTGAWSGAPGPVAVTVTTQGGTRSRANLYTYTFAPPTIRDVSPVVGPQAGGTTVTIVGAFDSLNPPRVWLGQIPCAIQSATGSTIVCTSGASPAIAQVDVKVETDSGAAIVVGGYVYDAVDDSNWCDLDDRTNDGALRLGPLDHYLRNCRTVRENLLWEAPDGTKKPYFGWTIAQRTALGRAFDALAAGNAPPLDCIDVVNQHFSTLVRRWDPTQAYPWPGTHFVTEQQAFSIYAAHAAHALEIEGHHRVPWSIVALPPEELRELIGSDAYFRRNIYPGESPNEEAIAQALQITHPYMTKEDALNATVCDPRDGWLFATGARSKSQQSLVGASEEETLANLTRWLRDNVWHLDHFVLDANANFADAHVSDLAIFSGLPARLSTRDFGKPGQPNRAVIANFGCHSASSLVRDLARSLNIPILIVQYSEEATVPSGMHRGLAFRWMRAGTRVLYHTDFAYHTHGLMVQFPTDGQGRPIVGGADLRSVFESVWEQPADLVKWNVTCESPPPLIDDNLGVALSIISNQLRLQYTEHGHYGGTMNTLTPDKSLYSNYLAEKMYQNCEWAMVEAYCGIVDGEWPDYPTVQDFYSSHGPTLGPGIPDPYNRTVDDFEHRAKQCVDAWGGCQAVHARGVALLSSHDNGWQ